MVRSAWILLFVAPILFAALSGCTSCESGPPVSARQIDSGDASAGVRGYELRVHVTDGPGGPPLEGAGVAVYYSNIEAGDWSGPRVDVGPDRIVVEPMNASATVEAKEVLRMRTGSDGVATARVPGDRIVGVVAAKEDFTEEWFPALASGGTGGSGDVTLPLYRQTVAVDMEGVWGPGAVSTGQVTSSQYEWDPHEIAFGASAEANRGYAARIVELTVTVNWTNSPPQAQGDLGIGVGPPGDGPRYFADGSENVGMGAQSETTTLSLDRLREHGILGAPSISAGAATDTGFLAPFGMPYTMRIEARFDTERAAFATCFGGGDQNDNDGIGAGVPGPTVSIVVLSLLSAAALLAFRSRRGPRDRRG